MKRLSCIAVLCVMLMAGSAWAGDQLVTYLPDSDINAVEYAIKHCGNGKVYLNLQTCKAGKLALMFYDQHRRSDLSAFWCCFGEYKYRSHCGDITTEMIAGKILSPEEARAERIKKQAASGEICRVLGHQYNVHTLETTKEGAIWATRKRSRCPICGKTENTKEEWR